MRLRRCEGPRTRVWRGVSVRKLHNHRRLSWTIRHSALSRRMVAGRHITDVGTVALALVIREFMGNDRSRACHSYEFGREGDGASVLWSPRS